MTSAPARTVPYLAAVQLADRAIQLQAEHQRAKAAWATEKSDFVNDRDRAEAGWEMERSDFLNERTRLLCEKVDLGIDKAVLYTANEKLKVEHAELQIIVEKLQAENRSLRTEQALYKNSMHSSAAYHVFAISELLEYILLQVPHSSRDGPCYNRDGYNPLYIAERAVPQLFELQRVSHQFAFVIAGSSALQTRMGLLELPNSHDSARIYEHPNTHAHRSGVLLKHAATTPAARLQRNLYGDAIQSLTDLPGAVPRKPLVPGDTKIFGSWTQIKVNLESAVPSQILRQSFFISSSVRREYEYATERKTTWGDVARWTLSVRNDVFERQKALEALSGISPDVFA
ncbi:hypothetical protein CKM354_001020400 [Cercospora kikuchii]|uniref:Uncharacterized protein n=1 Tax=Cercospora kikuchii TaxID=84275 RepID=A0A9P3CQI7_9PEZI|nr:uncharacterized protein CKM354_001020400 [Cercospora kikuchii]GIZ47104.1 hypothetical protein CKM354_001020400 [Cercospora kikuchii]